VLPDQVTPLDDLLDSYHRCEVVRETIRSVYRVGHTVAQAWQQSEQSYQGHAPVCEREGNQWLGARLLCPGHPRRWAKTLGGPADWNWVYDGGSDE
jgi:hypothetical protein